MAKTGPIFNKQTQTDFLIHGIAEKNRLLHLVVRAIDQGPPIETIVPIGFSRSVAVSMSD